MSRKVVGAYVEILYGTGMPSRDLYGDGRVERPGVIEEIRYQSEKEWFRIRYKHYRKLDKEASIGFFTRQSFRLMKPEEIKQFEGKI